MNQTWKRKACTKVSSDFDKNTIESENRSKCIDILKRNYSCALVTNSESRSSGGRQIALKCSKCSLRLNYHRRGSSNFWDMSISSNTNQIVKVDETTCFPCDNFRITGTNSNLSVNPMIQLLVQNNCNSKLIDDAASLLGFNTTKDVRKKISKNIKISGKEHMDSFSNIEPFLNEMKKNNPDMFFKVERQENSNLLKRLVVIPHYAKKNSSFLPSSVWIRLRSYETSSSYEKRK